LLPNADHAPILNSGYIIIKSINEQKRLKMFLSQPGSITTRYFHRQKENCGQRKRDEDYAMDTQVHS
jgi:hypothetical protein